MTKPHDIAAYIIELSDAIGEPITNMKLQKLIYYTYAWYAVEKKKPLFEEKISAWKYGPVVSAVYETYASCGADVISEVIDGDSEAVDTFTKSLIEDIFNIYGSKTAIELAGLSHSEAPWREVYDPDERDATISFESTLEYYTEKKEISG